MPIPENTKTAEKAGFLEKNTGKIYIAGKVTGEDPQKVTEKFEAAQNYLEQLGYEVMNPVRIVKDITMPWQEAMRLCIKALVECDHIYLLPCYSRSAGALLECQIAQKLDINRIYSFEQ